MTITLCVLFLSGVNKGRPWHGEGCKVEFRVGNLGAAGVGVFDWNLVGSHTTWFWCRYFCLMTSRCWVFGQRAGKTEAFFFQAVVFYGMIDIFAQISIWTEKTGEYCLPNRLAQRHLQKKFLFSSVVWNCSSHGPGATFLAARRLPNTDRGPWAGQHRPPPYFGATILAVQAHHTCRPTILVSISPTILRLHTCTILAGLPYLLVCPSYYQTCRQAPHTFEYFEVFLTYFVSTSPHGLLHDVHNCVFM